MQQCYLSLCMGAVWSAGWTGSNQQNRRHPYRVTNTSATQIQQFSPDDGDVDSRNMQRRDKNKHIKQNCAPSWIYLRDYTGIQGQLNIKYEIQNEAFHKLKLKLNCFVLCIVFCQLFCSMYCLFVNVYCTTATGCLPNCS